MNKLDMFQAYKIKNLQDLMGGEKTYSYTDTECSGGGSDTEATTTYGSAAEARADGCGSNTGSNLSCRDNECDQACYSVASSSLGSQ